MNLKGRVDKLEASKGARPDAAGARHLSRGPDAAGAPDAIRAGPPGPVST